MKDKETGQSRGFGFVTYSNPQCVTEVLKARPHTIDNKIVIYFCYIFIVECVVSTVGTMPCQN